MGPLRTVAGFVVAHGRNRRERSWRPILPVPCSGPSGEISCVFSLQRSQHGGGAGVFRECVVRPGVPWPRKINLDGNSATHRALRLLGEEDARWRTVEIRSSRYLNNVVEQDHRAIKRRCASMLGLKSFCSAAITLAGIELAHRIRKGQYSLQRRHDERSSSLKELWDAALKLEEETPAVCSCSSPPMHQISTARKPHESDPGNDPEKTLLEPVRYPRKVSFGGSLYMLLMPKGGRYWHYSYRYGGKRKTLSLGTYPDVPFLRAKARHQAARRLLAVGLDPSLKRKDLRSDGAEARFEVHR